MEVLIDSKCKNVAEARILNEIQIEGKRLAM